jgi:hypothetical protein
MTDRMIAIEKLGNSDYLDVHFDFEVETSTHGPSFKSPLVEKGDYWDSLSNEAKVIVRALMSVKGVSYVTVGTYKVTVAKARLFVTDIVAEAIKAALSEVLGDDTEIRIGLPDEAGTKTDAVGPSVVDMP